MKNSIPSDVWERKKALIAKLYKDEEWPLKQVIKQIRSADFNPSETQLRSRLKKWRVTKPSRQTRKKSNASQNDALEDDSSQESTPPRIAISVSPKSRVPRCAKPQMAPSTAESDWYMNNGVYLKGTDFATFNGHNGTGSWTSSMTTQAPMSPSSVHRHPSIGSSSMIPVQSGNPYDVSSVSPLLDRVQVNSASSMASFSPNTPYTTSTGSRLQAPVSTTTTAGVTPIAWSMPQWFTQPATAPFYSSAPLSPPIEPVMQFTPTQPPNPSYSSPTSHAQHIPGLYDDTKPVKRSLSDTFVSNTTGVGSEAAQSCRPQTSSEADPSFASKISGQSPLSLINPPSPFFPHGQHPVVCAPMYSYGGPEPLVHQSPSIGF